MIDTELSVSVESNNKVQLINQNPIENMINKNTDALIINAWF